MTKSFQKQLGWPMQLTDRSPVEPENRKRKGIRSVGDDGTKRFSLFLKAAVKHGDCIRKAVWDFT